MVSGIHKEENMRKNIIPSNENCIGQTEMSGVEGDNGGVLEEKMYLAFQNVEQTGAMKKKIQSLHDFENKMKRYVPKGQMKMFMQLLDMENDLCADYAAEVYRRGYIDGIIDEQERKAS